MGRQLVETLCYPIDAQLDECKESGERMDIEKEVECVLKI
jgi:hypothetical protein